ncbi:MAG: FAD-dependent oxidoreductase [Syntrophales bacterium]|nr:FAD-dependent oxidoreductase [Syntrophales bacterium]MDD4338077.1 NADH-ubiquinone oxidoreductase-F iron-sulfur binding region domain-containing protein [Syntrophales bacterium]HOG07114.1 NADH-ubiquinone oxidoreductase-F iron-sulfur binding region domain-containing protein [Syntrophales bacterium]HPB70032.1 NADH-ubiquinone oxidoreductase-F iron-sulfur binding region domain-containing protein [Syntrophales bacterium]HQN25797.1 NADH-ubiquinone oxidoreductase-F iron-sulfur binding region domain-
MKTFQTVAAFNAYRASFLTDKNEEKKPCIVICGGTGGQASGSNDLIRIIKRRILEQNLHDKLSLRVTGCLGFCEMDPFIIVEPGYNLYPKLKMENVPKIIDAAVKGEVVEELLYREPGSTVKRYSEQEIPFFQGQTRIVLGQNQHVDPIRIGDYLKMGGYAALEKALEKQDRAWLVDEILKSKLRGRGGAGFMTGRKWEMARNMKNGGGPKYIICNADEGDPGAYMDRSMLEGNPHAIIEGMIIAALAIGASDGIIYVRTEYPLAIKHATIAIREARRLGLLGKNILGRGVDFEIEVFHGAGAFVCGEETALIKSIEGKMGEPRQRPPYPIEKGLFGHPTCINNVETLANVPYIINHGAEAYTKIGVENNAGTKIFSLVGKIKNTGLVEVPLGTPINKVVYDIGGGPVSAARIKAIQTGGPSGGCIPASMFDLPIDYDSLAKAGSIMGSGGMIVMDENTCMVDVAKYFMSFLKDESCGKCFTCRKGTQRMHEILEDITEGRGTPEHLVLLEELALTVKDTTMCGLGQTAANPVMSTLRYFREEYERHIEDKKCGAFVCKQLTGAPCQAACPVDTEPWRYVAMVEKGDYEEAYRVIRTANPFPAVSARVCDRKCENRCSLGVSGGEAIAIRAIKRFVTDRVNPSVYKPQRARKKKKEVAVIGAGPAGLTAAHGLSLIGYGVTIYEAENQPGGMLTCSLPAYRLPRDIVEKEIKTLLNPNIKIEYGRALGKDMTLQDLLNDRFDAVFLSIGAHESWRLDLENEDVEGIFPSIQFLKAFNIRGEELARGHVGIIGGGNSAVDAARVALRQKDVTSVSLFYRRTREEMPAYEEEIDAALEEGVKVETLISPVKIHVRQEDIEAALKEGVELETLVTPIKIFSKEGRIIGIECIKNRLGEVDATGRRRPVPIPGSEFRVELDTLIVAIGEKPKSEFLASMGLDVNRGGRLKVDRKTLETSLKGVFAGGDLVTGPNTVIDAIAAGKKAAKSIDRFLQKGKIEKAAAPKLPSTYIEPAVIDETEAQTARRAEPAVLAPHERVKNFREVTLVLPEDKARAECRRCLRCDLAFTRDKSASQAASHTIEGAKHD